VVRHDAQRRRHQARRQLPGHPQLVQERPAFPKVQAYLNGGAAPTFTYHRFRARTAVATAYAAYDRLFGTTPTPTPTPTPTLTSTVDTVAPSVPLGLASAVKTATTASLAWQASTDNVGVTGYDVYRGATLAGSTTTTSFTDTGLTASTAYAYAVRAEDAAGNVSAASTALSVTTSPAAPAASCQVTYGASAWNTGFTASVKVTNTGTTAITGWSLVFSFANGQRVTQGCRVKWSQSGAQVTAANESWNGTLAAGQRADVGFNGSHSGADANPTPFALNRAACPLGLSRRPCRA
jgi:hypothetical protein